MAAEHLAQPGSLVLAPDVAAALAQRLQTLPLEAQGHTRLLGLAPGFELPEPQALAAPATLAGQERFVSPLILAHSASAGEFRQVVTAFINLMGVQSHADLEPFMQAVFSLQQAYGGYLARVDFGDKGCSLLLLWGAPAGREDDIERALNFTLALGEHTPGSYKAGLTLCPMYAGLAGNDRRGEWTCYGDGINLAARLMSAAPWGGLWLDERLERRAGGRFLTEALGEHTFKGFDAPQMVYALLERQRPELGGFYRGRLVGHAAELARLEVFVQPLLESPPRCAGILAVEGEAGLGKSRLVTEFLLARTAPAGDSPARVQWALCQVDPAMRLPFNAFRYWLRSYFDQSPAASAARNKRAFGRALDGLVAATTDPELQTELNRARPFLGALVDLEWENSAYAGLDPQGRYELTLAALVALVRAESRRCPLVINLEDAHWLDEDSLACIARLADSAADAPFAILATARPRIGDRPLFAALPYQRLELGLLGSAEMAQLAEDLLGGPIDPDLAALLDERAEGNPFFAEQILLYLREQGGLAAQAGRWQLASQPGSAGGTLLPADVRLVFTSRLDGLSSQVREVVQAAAILGREFEVRLLAGLLQGDERLPEWLQQAERSDIWAPTMLGALSEIRYLFRHALLRDAAYEMQLRARRRELHRLAAGALEQLYAADLEPHTAEIAYHYQAACRQGLPAVRLPAIDYLQRAGQRAQRNFENSAAVQAFSDALELLETDEDDRRWELLLQREAIYHLTALRAAQTADLDALAALAEASQQPAQRAAVALRRARYGLAISEYPPALAEAQAAAGLAQAAGRLDLEAEAQQTWAEVLWRMDRYPEAAERAQQALALARSTGQVAVQAQILNLLGMLVGSQGDSAASDDYILQSLPLSRQAGDRISESRILLNVGSISWNRGDLETTHGYFEQSLALARATGNRFGEGRALFYLGDLALAQDQFAAAQGYFEQIVALARATGERLLEAAALGALGSVAICLGNYPAARALLLQAQPITQLVGSQGTEGDRLGKLSWVFQSLGDYPQAVETMQTCLAISRAVGSKEGEWSSLVDLGDLKGSLGQLEQAGELVEQSLDIALQVGDCSEEAVSREMAGQVCLLKAQPAQAREQFEAALAVYPSASRSRQAGNLAGLALAALQSGDPGAAHAALERLKLLLAANPKLEGAYRPLRALLQAGQAGLGLGDPWGAQVIAGAYQLLQERAGLIPDPAERAAFLEKVPENRELAALYWQLQGAAAGADGPPPAPGSREALPPESQPAPAETAPGEREGMTGAASAALETPGVPPSPPEAGPAPVGPAAEPAAPEPAVQPLPPGLVIDKPALAAQLAALLGQAAAAQGVTLIILGDIHIQQVVVNVGKPEDAPGVTAKT